MRGSRVHLDRNHKPKPANPMSNLVMEKPLSEKDLDENPAILFSMWLEEARQVVRLPTIGCLSTASLPSGRISSRMVNVAEFNDTNQFIINSDWICSRKGKDVGSGNNHVALTFYWPELGRSVRVEGKINVLGYEESISATKFGNRPRIFQASVASGEQSSVVPDRKSIELAQKQLETKPEILMPHWWRCAVLTPDYYEFWQNRVDRISDRVEFTFDESWSKKRLHP